MSDMTMQTAVVKACLLSSIIALIAEKGYPDSTSLIALRGRNIQQPCLIYFRERMRIIKQGGYNV
ncbi:TPA: hypothetical protein G8O67_004760 [Salmonella enterica]|uniref:Uncharacterized protein n=1 Tax=Salmonella enterica TaxID=28901 RepID=A0A756I4L8_SALER|nr:hypothetical protein [Salmonella enterica]